MGMSWSQLTNSYFSRWLLHHQPVMNRVAQKKTAWNSTSPQHSLALVPTVHSFEWICCMYTCSTLWQTNSLLLKMAIYSEFFHEKWWFSIVMLVYQRVSCCAMLCHVVSCFASLKPPSHTCYLWQACLTGCLQLCLSVGRLSQFAAVV